MVPGRKRGMKLIQAIRHRFLWYLLSPAFTLALYNG